MFLVILAACLMVVSVPRPVGVYNELMISAWIPTNGSESME